jgi:hypothetical protein
VKPPSGALLLDAPESGLASSHLIQIDIRWQRRVDQRHRTGGLPAGRPTQCLRSGKWSARAQREALGQREPRGQRLRPEKVELERPEREKRAERHAKVAPVAGRRLAVVGLVGRGPRQRSGLRKGAQNRSRCQWPPASASTPPSLTGSEPPPSKTSTSGPSACSAPSASTKSWAERARALDCGHAVAAAHLSSIAHA